MCGFSHRSAKNSVIKEALASYDKAIQLKPDFAEAWSNRGVALRELKRYEEALASFDKALQIQPNAANSWYARGLSLSAMKR
ncbi:tetratricopeptide repeat protein [Pseudanabaena sp. PCC 6802]|uniref:tetratricopeptide repeat protein n=1 Tax=Pseudanabaena sp. PCC 6802 TaxID=118173 RepID=UPI000347B341|nr:tetratricopeptide repeat protein [Pseudanabaena sp. PCC 6802]